MFNHNLHTTMSLLEVLKNKYELNSELLALVKSQLEKAKRDYDEYRIKIVKEAILKSTPHTWNQIVSPKRPDSLTHCRVVFGYHCSELGLENEVICEAINRNRATTIYYPYDYLNCKNPDFLELAEKVQNNLKA